jgi:MFS family permease
VIGKRLFVLLACLFVVMIGFGITLPVLPFYVERLAQAEGATRQAIVLHVTLLTAVYPLGQLAFAPVWGRCRALRARDLFVWQMNAPYVLSGGVLVAIAMVIGWKALRGPRAATRASRGGGCFAARRGDDD